MMKIGLTGGMGSGKSTAAKIFEALSVPVFYADDESKNILENNPFVEETLSSRFGPDLFPEGKLDRVFLASQIFNNKEALAFVNSVMHPAVADRFVSWCDEQSAPYCLKEAAILFEIGSSTWTRTTMYLMRASGLTVQRSTN